MERGPFTIELTPGEIALVDAMRFDPLAFSNDHQAFRANAELAHQLTNRLLERDAIPVQRLRYFTDADYNPGGRGSSRRDVFERNGTFGDALLRHPHFLKFLRYFIHGAELPSSILTPFTKAVEDCGSITSGDIAPLSAAARQLVRTHSLDSKAAAEELYKLCLDLGLGADDAASIRSSVQQVRPRR